jgi:ketosteroid isomerase-like protein
MRNTLRDTVLALHRRHARAWERRNLDEMRDIFAGDAIIFNTEPPARFSDFKTFENTLQQYFAHIEEVSFITSNIQIEAADPFAWVTSLYLKAYHRNGELVRESGRWTEVYAPVGGDWKLVHFHASRDPS